MDGALPSGNTVAIKNLMRLASLTQKSGYLERARRGLSAFSGLMEANPMAFGEMLTAVGDFHHPPNLVASEI